MKPSTKQPRRKTQRNRGGTSTTVDVSSGPGVPRNNFLKTTFAGIETSARRTLSYFTYLSFTQSPSAFAEPFVAVLNGPYDPNTALGGLSATGYAKMMQFYSKSYVLGARIKVRYANLSTAGGSQTCLPIVFGVTITTSTAALSTAEAAVTAGLADYRLVCTTPDACLIDLGVNTSKFMDVPDVLDRPDLYGTNAAVPSQVIIAHVWYQSLLANASSGAITVEIEFDTVFTDPVPFT